MSIKSGELIHVGNQVIVDRAQTAGPGSLNIKKETIYELGNYQSVGVVRDIPDLSFSLDSYDCSASLEALLLDVDFSSLADGAELDISTCLPLDVASQFKAGRTATSPFEIEGSVAIPHLYAESLKYSFGLSSDASQSVSLKGDGLYYSNGSTYIETTAGTGSAGQTVTLAHTALPYEGDTTNGVRHVLSVSLVKAGKRLTPGVDYTEAATGTGTGKSVTVTVVAAVPVSDTIRVVYQSDVKASYPQASNAPDSAVKPAALRGRDIEVRVAGTAITDRWSGVQSFDATWQVTLQQDEEFANPNYVSQDFDVPAVSGKVTIKPRDVQELLLRVRQIAGVSDGSIVGPLSSVALPLEVILHSPIDGSVLKTIYVPDARFDLPGFSGKVQQKLTVDFNFTSDGGLMYVYKGAKPTG